jgi:POT family proton-dependent oligopeptide transporter
MTTTAENLSLASSDTPKGHPRGLYILFGTEMWERFSYYGMRALLVLYLVQHHGWQPQDSSAVYKWYTSLVYLTPLIGGFLADRYLGLRAAIITGGVLMAIGHFLMAFEPLPMFYTALVFLILGNGFFKPNISTLVGKLYKKGDGRRDGAFTIFYMGINVGAGLAPLVCGEWLQAHYGFHYGFGAAGVGMVIGLSTFLLGQRQILKDVAAAGNSLAVGRELAAEQEEPKAGSPHRDRLLDEPDEAEPAAGGAAGIVAKVMPFLMIFIAVAVPAKYIYLFATHQATITELFMPVAFSAIAGGMAAVLLSIKGAARDKSIVIFSLFIFVVLFWMAFEQAGNALNLWAEFHTDRHLGSYTYSAASFQSVNAICIVVFAPLFAWMWVRLARAGREPSTPMKMGIAMVFIALSFLAMVGAAIFENRGEARAPLATLPQGVDVSKMDAGRLRYDPASHELVVKGVLPPYVVNLALKESADPTYTEAITKLVAASAKASVASPVTQVLEGAPPDYKPSVGKWDPAAKTLQVSEAIDAPTRTQLFAEGAPPAWKSALRELGKDSEASRVGGFWLFLSYLLATLGELCLSPVGLSMVTKLAPARFGSLFMGVWLLSSSVAQYAGGSIGETWGKISPTEYFNLFVVTSFVGAGVLFVLVLPLKRLMHNAT